MCPGSSSCDRENLQLAPLSSLSAKTSVSGEMVVMMMMMRTYENYYHHDCWYFKDVDADQFLNHMKKILPVVAFRYDFLAFCLNEGRLQFALQDRLMIFRRMTFIDGSRCGAGWLCGQVVPPPLSCTVQPPFGGKATVRSLE